MGRINRPGDRCIRRLLARCAQLKVAVALANKTARIAWVIMARGEIYRRAAPA
jgi:transposase